MANYLLHIDTSADEAIIAISNNGLLLAHAISKESRGHASAINNLMQKVLAEVNCSFQDLKAVVVCGGPGSYTGLRIGMATAKGLCYATDKPMIVDNKLTLLAYKAYNKYRKLYMQYVSLVPAREKEYFIGIYDNNFNCTLEPQHIREEQIMDVVRKTDNSFFVTNVYNTENILPHLNELQTDHDPAIDLESWCAYAFDEYKCNNIVNFAAIEPFYLKQVYTHK
jgi:tRNA threonylcarbamoyladenosine biosynthesis protein TsaB